MIDQTTIDAFNTRQTVDLNSIKTMKPEQHDKVKHWGSQAEVLLQNRELALFVHQFKFELCDVLAEIKTHSAEDNALRISVSNQIAGIDNFIASLKRAVYFKNRVVQLQQAKLNETEL